MSRLRRMLSTALLVTATALPAVAAVPESSATYREGQRALEAENWDEASRLFGKVASGSSDETDAALYWKAYADWKRKQKKEAVEGLRRLLSAYPGGAWADDARALELEIRGAGDAKGAAGSEDEELKLYALDGLMQASPEQAIPVLEKLLATSPSRRVKERALFVLSQSDSPRAREILMRIARSGEPVELRCEAIKTLAIAGDTDGIAAIARDTSAPREVREAVIEAYIIANRPDELLGIARSDGDPRLRGKAVEALAAVGARSALRQLYGSEQDPALRAKLLEALGVAGDVETLAKAARETSDPKLRRKAIEGLAISNGKESSKVLRQLYAEYTDPEDRRKVLEGFMIQGDATTLIDLFRAEKDPAMKRVIVQQLSVMDDPEATRVLLELLEK